MTKFLSKLFLFNLICSLFLSSISVSDTVKKIKISGNERISDETILIFSNVNINDELKDSDLNQLLKDLYSSNFFNKVSVKMTDNILSIYVEEFPLIQNITITGIKAQKYKDIIIDNRILKPKSSFNKFILMEEIKLIKSKFKSLGFYFAKVETEIEEINNNLVNINYIVDIGEKSKISKILFNGNKIYKSKKLKSVIISEEYKFWKFISGKKYLQEQIINLDERLLKNFYLNNGFYNVKINSTFAKLDNKDEFNLIFNINPGKKVFFGNLDISLPNDFDHKNYENLDKLFNNLEKSPYSLNAVNKILEEIDKITIEEEFKTINASVEEVIADNKLNINFIIEETEKFFVEKINIYGNNITRESVIRNQLEIDEGDPYSDILAKKSENNIKSLNFFKQVQTQVVDGNNNYSKIINIQIEEKPTGEIMAGAGAGTDGGSIYFGIKENNYLGKGLSVDANATVSGETFKGKLSVTNPNYNNSDRKVYASIQAIEIDQLENYGYKTNKSGFEVGTNFEYLEDFYLGLSTNTFVEEIETNSNASASQKRQAGNYLDTFLNLDFNLDKRNQKFKPSDGFFVNYDVNIPIVSDTNTLTNTYNYKMYKGLYENNISSFSILLRSATSLSNDDIKLTERLSIPSSKLRGFERGKIGPKDGSDFIGGNFLASINFQSNLPIFFQNSQNLDAIIFFDVANVWGVDYDSSIDDGSEIRSSIGIGVDWLTVIGPVTFSLAHPLSKKNSDIEETFRFNLGTTF